ncbi:hypothetical protein ACA910_018020 [Epithemia clementina (nom. ined.)]
MAPFFPPTAAAAVASSSSMWTIQDYCLASTNSPKASTSDDYWSTLPDDRTRDFLQSLELPMEHPFCSNFCHHNDCNSKDDNDYYLPDIPRQGPLLHHDHLETMWDVLQSIVSVSIVPLQSMTELWLRFFALVLAPTLILAILVFCLSTPTTPAAGAPNGIMDAFGWLFSSPSGVGSTTKVPPKVVGGDTPLSVRGTYVLGFSCLLAVASSIVLLTDSMYNMEFGPGLGGSFLAIATTLSLGVCQAYNLVWTRRSVGLFLLLTLYLVLDYNSTDSFSVHFGEPMEHATVEPGLYYHADNTFLHRVVSQYWPSPAYTYSYDNGATPWMVTGDSRTGFPFVLNKVEPLQWHRLWLPVDDGEVVALDFTFPSTGYDATQPIYMVLHGINGGTHENFIKDFAWARTSPNENATVCVMVARGLEDLPIRGWNNFHGARWTDAHQASLAIRKGLSRNQLLVGVGYSMGGIILSNLVGRAGKECALDAAIAFSGGLDMRFQTNFFRAQRLFQPIVTVALRGTFVLGKWGERVRARLSRAQMKELMHGTHVTDIDRHCVVPYNGFRDVEHYYSEMSLLGDLTSQEYDNNKIDSNRRVHQVSVPTVIVHAIDDPLITWRTVAANQGVLYPTNLTKAGSGNLMILLTKTGGHVGWPLGVLPHLYRWKWMNDIPATFAKALMEAKKHDDGEAQNKQGDEANE